MKICINNHNIDFTLENEKTIKDVVNHLEAWLKQSGFLITDINIDNKQTDILDILDGKDILLDKVKKLDIKAQIFEEVRIAHLNTVNNYFKLLIKALEEQDEGQLKELIKNYSLMLRSLEPFFAASFKDTINQIIVNLNKLFAGSTVEMIKAWPAEIKEQAVSGLNELMVKIGCYKKELENPLKVLSDATNNLKKSVEDISDVSILLQTGKDRDAMNSIIIFSELCQKILRIYTNIRPSFNLDELNIADKPFLDYYSELNNILNELIDAFMKKDSVLIGDLLEYEIAPRVKELIVFTEDFLKNSKIYT